MSKGRKHYKIPINKNKGDAIKERIWVHAKGLSPKQFSDETINGISEDYTVQKKDWKFNMLTLIFSFCLHDFRSFFDSHCNLETNTNRVT